ncbi:PhoH family protein [Candidatus Saccharibacteria bacterium]|nr:PhoH family protein [Candidatus Saccharibacteria bacterium]
MPSYVVDTNVVVDYVDIIPNGNTVTLDQPIIDLNGAHLIIPTSVIRELSSFKTENTDRGRAAREALRRLRKIIEKTHSKMSDVYALRAPISVHEDQTHISILPVSQNFTKVLPFRPSDHDMDGQIILTALSALFSENGVPVDGTELSDSHFINFDPSKVVLLTNDNGMAIRAKARGLHTSRFGYKQPKPYTGRRDLMAPDALVAKFCYEGLLDPEDFYSAFPDQPSLVDNEFIVFSPESGTFPNDYDPLSFHNIGRFRASDNMIVALEHIYNFPISPKNAGQAIYAEALMDPSISCVICTGPAGSGKTFMAAVWALETCRKNSRYIGITVVPCNIENDTLGALPGDLDAKLDPNVQPIKNALKNYRLMSVASHSDSKKSRKAKIIDEVEQLWTNWFENIPIAYARGRDFSHEIAIFDEFQDQNRKQADTLLKRIGQGGKIVITGDIEQIHAAYLDRDSNGITFARQLLANSPLVAQVTFTEEEVVRHPLVKMIAQRQREQKSLSSNV